MLVFCHDKGGIERTYSDKNMKFNRKIILVSWNIIVCLSLITLKKSNMNIFVDMIIFFFFNIIRYQHHM